MILQAVVSDCLCYLTIIWKLAVLGLLPSDDFGFEVSGDAVCVADRERQRPEKGRKCSSLHAWVISIQWVNTNPWNINTCQRQELLLLYRFNVMRYERQPWRLELSPTNNSWRSAFGSDENEFLKQIMATKRDAVSNKIVLLHRLIFCFLRFIEISWRDRRDLFIFISCYFCARTKWGEHV